MHLEPVYTNYGDQKNFKVSYFVDGDSELQAELEGQWQSFNRYDPATRNYYKIWVRPTTDKPELAVDYFPSTELTARRYRIETFIPGRHATTRKATFVIAHDTESSISGETRLDESIVLVDMSEIYDVWYSLGEYKLDPSDHPEIGRVRQFAFTREDPEKEISFGPVRWIPLIDLPSDGHIFDSPVGSEEERCGPFPSGNYLFGKYPLWAGQWFDINPFLNWYSLGCHTGSDLNLPGSSGADKGKPVYAIGDGLVTYAGKAGTWGSIVVIEHPEAIVTFPDGSMSKQMVYSRYGHVESEIPVSAGQRVTRGQLIGHIGLAPGYTAGWHLHFDISYTDILKKRPSHWPDMSGVQAYRGSRDSHGYTSAQNSVIRQVMSNYIDPFKFLQENHVQRT